MEAAITRSWEDRARRLLPPGSIVFVARSHIENTYRMYVISGQDLVELGPYLSMFCTDGTRLLSPEAQITVLGQRLWGDQNALNHFERKTFMRWVERLPDGFPSHPAGHVYTLRYL